MKKVILVVLAMVGIIGVASWVQPVSAITCPAGSQNTEAPSLAECSIPHQKDDEPDINSTIVNAINIITGIVGLLAVVVMILGGITFITSQGDAAKVAKAKHTVLYGVVGLVVALLAFAIVNFVMGIITPKTGGDDDGSDEDEGYVRIVDDIDRIA